MQYFDEDPGVPGDPGSRPRLTDAYKHNYYDEKITSRSASSAPLTRTS